MLALDSNGKKLEELRRRSRRAGLTNVAAREVHGGELPAEAKRGAWDRVLVDAPCSGLGTLRRNPEARWRLAPKTIDGFPAQQLSLMVTYAPLVAPGGRLIYATCTLLRRENEEVVERFLAERPDFVIMPLKEIWAKSGSAPGRRHVPEGVSTQPRHRRLLCSGASPAAAKIDQRRRGKMIA